MYSLAGSGPTMDLPTIHQDRRGETAARDITSYRKDIANNIYDPLLHDTAAQIGNSGIVDDAREQVQGDPARLAARMKRQRDRMGMEVSNAQLIGQERGMELDNSLRASHTINTARIAEDEFDQMARRGIINYGTGMLNTAQQSANTAGQVAAGIKAQNEQGQQANNAAWLNVGSAIIGKI